MAKINKRVLVKHAKALNDLDLLDEPVETKGDVETIKGDFMDAVEEIDDNGQLDEIDDDIIDYFESLVKADEDGGEDDDGGKDDDDDKGKGKARRRRRSKDKDKGEDDDPLADMPDLEDLEDELNDMDYDGLCDYADDNEIEFNDQDEDEDIIADILKHWKKKIRAAKRAAKKDKPKDKGRRRRRSRGKDKDDDDGKGRRRRRSSRRGRGKDKPDLPTGLRNGTLPAILYLQIADGGATWGELAKTCAKEKDKDVKAVMGLAMRTVSRNISKRAPIQAIFTGEDETAVFTVVNADSGDDD